MRGRLQYARAFVLGALFVSATAGAHQGHTKTTPAAPELEDVEELDLETAEAVEIDDSPTPEDSSEQQGLLPLIAYFHAATVHMPIAWVLLLVLIDLAHFLLGRQELGKVGYYLLPAAALSFVPAIVSGLTRLQHLGLEDEALQQALFHRNLGFAAFAMLLVALVLRWRAKNNLRGTPRHAYLGFLLVAALLVSIGGHLGGSMIFGDPPF